MRRQQKESLLKEQEAQGNRDSEYLVKEKVVVFESYITIKLMKKYICCYAWRVRQNPARVGTGASQTQWCRKIAAKSGVYCT
ncbi:hypothetical protein A2V82_05240 [candidate division KSB1 bacterium RBG_16_48_16]|nr:MAG: hypothetical protein A2V82_05240 [candidate division KSB1 bacterium RBG_16_48_16]